MLSLKVSRIGVRLEASLEWMPTYHRVKFIVFYVTAVAIVGLSWVMRQWEETYSID